MNLKRIYCLALIGFLFKGGYETVQASPSDNADRPIAVMENPDGTFMDDFYLGEGITVFFHPKTKEFQCTAIASNANLKEYQNLNYNNPEDIKTFILQKVKNLFGEDSIEYQTLTERITENSQEKSVRSTLNYSGWTIAPHSTRKDGQSLYAPKGGLIMVEGSITSRKIEPRSSLNIGIIQPDGTHTSFINSKASFSHSFSQLPAGYWSLRITNNYSVSQSFTGVMYN